MCTTKINRADKQQTDCNGAVTQRHQEDNLGQVDINGHRRRQLLSKSSVARDVHELALSLEDFPRLDAELRELETQMQCKVHSMLQERNFYLEKVIKLRELDKLVSKQF